MSQPRERQIRLFDTSLRIDAPGPRGVPAANNLRFLATAHRYALRAMTPFRDQPVVPVTGGNGSMVVAFGETAVRQVFTDNATFHRAAAGVFNLPPGRPWSRMFEAVITANGEDHRRRRKLLMPVVHRSAMEHYREIFADTFARSRFADPADERPFDLVAELLAMSKRNMLLGMLGVADTEDNRQLAVDIVAMTSAIIRPEVVLFRVDRPFTPYGRWLSRVAGAYDRLAELVDERRDTPGDRLDALTIVANTADENGDALSTEEIAGELHGFFAAGFETTAMTMTWALLTLLASPDAVADTGRDPADEELVDAVIKESQRLLPAVPMSLPRRVTADVSIDGSPPVPAGAMLFLSAVVEQHNPDVYADPHAFVPARWLPPAPPPKPQSFFPFGIGARRCLGAAFADLQARVTLGALAAQGAPLTLLTPRVDYRTTSAVVGAPRKPIMVRFGPPAPPPRLTGSVADWWRQA
jgi:cytochrome P450